MTPGCLTRTRYENSRTRSDARPDRDRHDDARCGRDWGDAIRRQQSRSVTGRVYSKLPLEDPSGCYIATAAARGHPAIVKSWPVQLAGGKILQVNRQLAILKAGELALRALAPRLHCALRWIYDFVGPMILIVLFAIMRAKG